MQGIPAMTCLGIVVFNGNFLLADGAPKLDGQLCNVFFVILHALNGEAKQCLFHVKSHFVIVEAHDPVEAAVGALLDARVLGLCSFANDLHDVVALPFILKVTPDEFERVAQGGNGRIPDLLVGLLFAGTLDDGREDGVGVF